MTPRPYEHIIQQKRFISNKKAPEINPELTHIETEPTLFQRGDPNAYI